MVEKQAKNEKKVLFLAKSTFFCKIICVIQFFVVILHRIL